MKLPDNMHFTADAPAALAGADIVVLALPAQVLRSQLQSFARYIEPNAMLVSLAKGLETGTGSAHVASHYRGTGRIHGSARC